MTVRFEVPDELAACIGPNVHQFAREAFALQAIRQNLWSEGQVGEFLGLSRHALWQFLKDHDVDSGYTVEDLKHDREVHQRLLGI